jgi:PAS domain S-box-containing protein
MPEPSSGAPNPAATEPRASVLLVDDDPGNLLALEVLLDGLGLNLVRARTGEEALARLDDQPFALVLLDVVMPGMDGFETARRIRDREPNGRTPIIFVTGRAADEFPIAQAYQLGAVDYLVKPLLPEILRAKVTGLVELHEEKERARRQAEQFRLLIAGVRDYAIFMLDPEGRVATWNAGAERIKQYTAADIIGRHFSLFYPQEDKDRHWPAAILRRATAEGRFEDTGWRVRKDGSKFWANVVITALRDEAGCLRGFSKVTRDLTETKKAEDALRRLHEELEQRVRDRTADLAAANEALREANRRKDEFLAMLAHELRNPLAPIRTGLQVLSLPQADRSATDKVREMMVRQIQHMGRIVDDLLDVSRIHQRKVTLRRERLDLARLVRLAVEDHEPAFDAAGVALTLNTPDGPVWVHGDQTRLTQVVGNLLHNSLKFTDAGGSVAVRVAAGPDGRATIAVRDTGLGIEPDMLGRLFEPFAQADRSLARSKGGLGLGLALVKGLTDLHGGSVLATSAGPSQGAEFVIKLPVQAEPTPAPAPSPPPANDRGRLRVLVVEDNRAAADSLRVLLELFGYTVEVAYTGQAGVEAATTWQPDVILCDIGLPGLDGYKLATQLRQNPATAQARLIALTGYGTDEDRRRSREAGFDAHLTKPADPAALRALLNRSGRK